MNLWFHPEFAQDVVRFAGQYGAVSSRLERRFRMEVEDALEQIKAEPTAAGHFLNTGSQYEKAALASGFLTSPMIRFNSGRKCKTGTPKSF